MTSPVAICNIALGWLGANPILSFLDNSDTARLCGANYEPLRDTVLEARTWTFATSRAYSHSTTHPAWGDGFVHPVPEDWLLVLRVYPSANVAQAYGTQANVGVSDVGQSIWVREGSNIISDDSNAYMWGLRRVADPDDYTPSFVQALAARIAADLCVPVTQNVKLQADLWSLYEAKLTEAASRDGAQGRVEVIGNSQLVAARAGGGG
jgi:hypothetical protein